MAFCLSLLIYKFAYVILFSEHVRKSLTIEVEL